MKKSYQIVLQKIADSYEDDLLEFNNLLEEYFNFFLRLLIEGSSGSAESKAQAVAIGSE